MTDGKVDCEKLLQAALPFAEQMLREHGEFFPFGAVMKTNGEVASVGGHDGRENPPASDVIDLLAHAFRAGARSKEFKATALIYDARTVPPGKTEKTDAVAAELEHVGGYAVTVFFPYSLSARGPVFGQSFATTDRRGVFSARR